jgi:hypothetical protein
MVKMAVSEKGCHRFESFFGDYQFNLRGNTARFNGCEVGRSWVDDDAFSARFIGNHPTISCEHWGDE